MSDVIVAHGVEVELGGTPVLREVGLVVTAGEVLAVVGENGAGKSTLLRCVAGLQPTRRGEIDVFGRPPADAPSFWKQVVMAGDEPAWYPGLSVREHLELASIVHEGSRMTVDQALEEFELDGRADLSPLSLSTGQRQRLSLAVALLRPSRLLLLDEPERGLDAGGRAKLTGILKDYAAGGGTVVMATHDLELANATGARLITLEPAS
ncbi:heme ABC exporter ATP-binding protein CcmA [Sphaerisporangium sp. B11E5]|uniref:heme ABC exporter ATP-binding protein CcmA n=1 Tax=Sphaerisporangium sp. B11E5 TaxID=3153563 RepID=UPI00325D8833